MPLEYVISTGALVLNGKLIGHGYSGAGLGKNNHDMCRLADIGPIPPGNWAMTGVKDSPRTGPFSIVLEPAFNTMCYGRSAFRIHGDNKEAPGTASHGCIVTDRTTRKRIWHSGVRNLEVSL